MNNRKYKTDPKVLLKQGKAIMASSNDQKYLFRVFAVNMVLSGFSAAQVGASAGVSKMTVTSWVKKADEIGFEALKSQPRSGRPPKLSKEQKSEIDNALQNDPHEYGFKIWDGPSLSSYIANTYGINISVRHCQRLFHELGYSRVRPQPYPSKGYENTEKRLAFKKNGLK